MKKYISTILFLSVMLSLLLGLDVAATEFDNKEALQMYMVENTLMAIKKSKEARKNLLEENSRSIASNTNDEEFDNLINDESVEHWFDQINELETY
ncbi:MAG: hypothetical protein A2202_08260 [Bdellovibrionales bacterium RIFOXYA1_FULL_36_14]|nr:MAG: hypothetical protein A2202_08260 [Bdellovibrionales bacterium RIFOXYA1_FULL_36_14]